MNKHLFIVVLILSQVHTWAQDTKDLQKKALPTPGLSAPTKACAGDTVVFLNKSNSSNVHWDFGDATDTRKENPKHIYEKGGTYTVKITAILDNRTSAPFEHQIEIFPAPEISLSYSREASEDTVKMWIGQTVTVTVNEALVNYDWYRFTEKIASGDPSFTTSTPGNYNVKGTTNLGCSSQKPFWIISNERPDDIIYTTIIVENNILTPNNDGINDVLFVKYLGNPEIYEYPLIVSIYNKQGVLVFQTNDYKNDWNALNTKSDDLSTGTYYFVAQSQGRRGKTGYIDVIRAD